MQIRNAALAVVLAVSSVGLAACETTPAGHELRCRPSAAPVARTIANSGPFCRTELGIDV